MPAVFAIRGPAILLLALLSVAQRSYSLEPDIQLQQVQHRAFLGEGGPAGVRALLETPDGRLWVAGASGVANFDGLRWVFRDPGFPPLPGNSVTAGCSFSDGTLWLGFENGYVVRSRAGHNQIFGQAEGAPGGTVRELSCAPNGIVWVAAEEGVARWQSEHWSNITREWGLPVGPAVAVLATHDSAVWVATRMALFRRGPADHAFKEFMPLKVESEGGAQLAESADGALWLGTGLEGLLRIAPAQDVHEPPQRIWPSPVKALLIDRDGCVWFGGSGLHRTCGGKPIESVLTTDGLGANDIRTLFEDVKGQIWAASPPGLDLFVTNVLVDARLPMELDGEKGLIAGQGDEVWVGDRTHDTVLQLSGDRVMQRLSVPSPQVGYRDGEGAIWFAGERGLTRLSPGVPRTWPLPEGAKSGRARGIARDDRGALWISFGTRGLFRFADGEWHDGGGVAGLPNGEVNALITDASGDLWLGYASGLLAQVRNGSVHVFGKGDGLDVGIIQGLSARGPRLWIGGDKALALREGARFFTTAHTNCGPAAPVGALLEAADGMLWAVRPFRFASLPGARRAIMSGANLDCYPYRADDGMVEAAQTDPVGPPLAETDTGRLWVAAGSHLLWTDAQRSRKRDAPPVITIDYLESSDGSVRPHADLRFRAGTREMDFWFSIWRLHTADKPRFRYRVLGVHDDWHVSARETRDLRLVNLGPGHFVLQVQAMGDRDERGRWGPLASVSFEILPYFYQAWWFYTLLALLAVAIIAVLFRMQLRRANARTRARIEARMLERERLARELHDTLLQGLQGLIFHFQAIAARISPSEPAVGMMENVLNRADAVMLESRNRVAELRETPRADMALSDAVTDAARHLVQDRPLEVRTKVRGRPRPLDAAANEEILLIAREALSNAVHHAQASCIEVELGYEWSCIRLGVRDDGSGIDTEVIRLGGREGHFGLRGMHERARRLRGWVRISNLSPRGTEIEVRIPASVAYARRFL